MYPTGNGDDHGWRTLGKGPFRPIPLPPVKKNKKNCGEYMTKKRNSFHLREKNLNIYIEVSFVTFGA